MDYHTLSLDLMRESVLTDIAAIEIESGMSADELRSKILETVRESLGVYYCVAEPVRGK